MTDYLTDPTALSALVGSRLCHDLISPMGAIGNGVEMLDMAGSDTAEERRLIGDAVAQANARLRFFRIAFGMADSIHRLGPAEVAGVLRDVTRGSRLKIDWQVTQDMPRSEVRRAFLLIQCVETALAFGGSMTVRHPDGRWTIVAEAPRLRDEPGLWRGLTEGPEALPDALPPGHVHFALLAIDQARARHRAEVEVTASRLSVVL
jgi:histidine phosphotransferase ChpT